VFNPRLKHNLTHDSAIFFLDTLQARGMFSDPRRRETVRSILSRPGVVSQAIGVSTMASRTNKFASHRGASRPCGWYSSCAAALFGVPANESAMPLQTTALALSIGDVRKGASGPSG
jgi:hypothetical protein